MSPNAVTTDIQTLRLVKPHAVQQKILDSIEHPDIKYCLVNCGRQVGKTTFGWNYLTYKIQKSNTVGVWVSRWHKQSKKVMDTMRKHLSHCPLVEKFKLQDKEILFVNGSVIKFYSAENYEAIRGETIDWLVLDEFALFKEAAWKEVIKPTLATRENAKVLMLSTPRGKGWWYDLFKKANSNEISAVKWSAVKASSMESPYVSKEFIEEFRESVSSSVFKQEILAEFIDDAGSVFEYVDTCANSDGVPSERPGEVKVLYAGLDLGFKNDYTVLTLFDSNYKMIDWFRANDSKQNYDKMAEEIKSILDGYELQGYDIKLSAEVNKFDSVITLLRQKGVDVEEFTTTSKSKIKIIENLMTLFQTKRISILDREEIKDELFNFEYNYNPKTRNVSFGAREGSHDDIVMSMAIAVNQIFKPKKKPKTTGWML